MKSAHLKPLSIKTFEIENNQKFVDLLTVNQPKINKNSLKSAILHLSPYKTSGRNLCENAFNCSKLCLHFSGQKMYHNAKFKARMRKSNIYNNNPNMFMKLLLLNICHLYKSKDIKNIRLNGTSDCGFLSNKIIINSELSSFIFARYGIHFCNSTYENIFDLFLSNNIIDLNFYDYTKILSKEKIKQSKLFKYDLTFSFDGWNNNINLNLCNLALNNNIRVAACFKHVKKGESFQDNIRFLNHCLKIEDGDLHDERYRNSNYCIIGLRFKRPQAFKVSQEYIDNFCIDTI